MGVKAMVKRATEKQKKLILNLIAKINPEELANLDELRRVKSFNDLSVKEASVIIQKLLKKANANAKTTT